MKTVEIIGYKRANLGKKESKHLRDEGNVPCVLYGGEEQVHFYAPMILFREIVYTGDAHMVELNIEGEVYRCILQDIQFHPVSEIILHADFLQLHAGKPVKMDIPVHLVGRAPGVEKGGTLMHKRRKLRVQALPKNMPEFIEVNISELDFNKAVKVSEVEEDNFTILDAPQLSIAVVEVPRALKGKSEEEEEELEAAEGAAAPEEGGAPAEEGDAGEA
ncbi:50S ribosomal protein L25/general stress protein Ctc [Fulvivirgaceae bacterium BMA12]|uniref:Large ribosomal subunit protein bL25 n=1 Tax=Agaribacillus aureus TaxID=3051825 RepID=A0ABT8L1C2_9BACT|nr:50S ribosomal protein L25/general stress protein Ctc [Fulvivirgaceae bacterium BMA12]